MNKNNKSTEEILNKQRQDRQQEEQYDNVASLGWKKFGIVFLVIVVAIVIYAVFFN